MSDSFVRRFLTNLQKPPEPRDTPPLIPQRLRIPFFLGLSAVSLIILLLLVWFVVIPAIGAQQQVMPSAPASTRPSD